ncbi:MAG: DUF5717 family protein [Lachnospiraceae bacterium]|nr:DUF5717 family protein [Lachnospiraceae bacterium]
MKEKILNLTEGEFERNFPEPLSDTDRIEKSGTEGHDIAGSIRIYTDSDLPLEGEVFSSNPYVTVEQKDFNGMDFILDFTAHTAGFYPGEKIEGAFTAVTDGYNLRVPYSFTVTEKYPVAPDRQIKTLEDLYELEKNDRRQAVSVFSSEDFRKLLIRHFPDSLLSYRALTGTMGFTQETLESFLCENGLKDRIKLHVFPAELNYYAVNEDMKESFRITRNTDGYVSLAFEVPEDSFISLGKTEATDQDFYGGTLEVPFFIKSSMLHKGVNQTSLTISGNGIRIKKEVRVSTYGKNEEVYKESRERKKVICDGMKGYLDFRLRKTDTAAFLKSATDTAEYFLNQNPADLSALLYRTMAQIVAGEKQKALVTIAMLKEMITDHKSYEWAFLLYLCTLMDPEEGYIDRITAEIESIEKEEDDARIFWFLLFLRKEYTENPLKRLSDIRKWINRGNYSPVLYAEAFDVINAYPQYIGQLDSFSLSILRFGQRNGVISKEVVPFVSECLYDLKDFNPGVFDFVGKLYDRYDDDMLLQAIVSYLLRNRCIGKKYAIWYKRGIEVDLNLTGIYENYMYCVDEEDTGMLPQLLLMYFSYENNELSEEKKEYLYANVIMYKERRSDIYEAYKSQTERFAIEKLQEGKIDDFLSVIYRDLYKRDFFDEELKKKLYDLKDSLKVFCLSQDSGKLSIYTDRLKKPFVTDLRNHSAIIRIRDKNFFTVLTNQNGVFSDKELFYTEKLLPELSEDIEENEGADLYISSVTDEAFADRIIAENDYDLVSIDDIPDDIILQNRRPEVVTFILRHLIEDDRTDLAFSLMKEVNGFKVPENELLHLATQECEKEEPDEFLCGLSVWLLDHYLSNKVTLDYLCRNYEGPTSELICVFKYAKARGCDVSALAGRIIEQMIFEEGDYTDIADVFTSYRIVHPDMNLVRAYLTYFSDRYVRDEKAETDDDFFKVIKDMYVSDHSINASLKTALLKYYSSLGSLKPEQMKTAEELLCDDLLEGRYFSFYKKMDIKLIREFGLYERVFTETRGTPGKVLRAYFYPGTDKEFSQDMEEVYDGIYITSMILFRGETADYVIKDETGKQVARGTVVNQNYPDSGTKSRFGLINEISEEEKSSDSALSDSIKEYIRLDLSSDDLFSMV